MTLSGFTMQTRKMPRDGPLKQLTPGGTAHDLRRVRTDGIGAVWALRCASVRELRCSAPLELHDAKGS